MTLLLLAVIACGYGTAMLVLGLAWGAAAERDRQHELAADLFDRRLTIALQLRDDEWKRALNEPPPAPLFDWAEDDA